MTTTDRTSPPGEDQTTSKAVLAMRGMRRLGQLRDSIASLERQAADPAAPNGARLALYVARNRAQAEAEGLERALRPLVRSVVRPRRRRPHVEPRRKQQQPPTPPAATRIAGRRARMCGGGRPQGRPARRNAQRTTAACSDGPGSEPDPRPAWAYRVRAWAARLLALRVSGGAA